MLLQFYFLAQLIHLKCFVEISYYCYLLSLHRGIMSCVTRLHHPLISYSYIILPNIKS